MFVKSDKGGYLHSFMAKGVKMLETRKSSENTFC